MAVSNSSGMLACMGCGMGCRIDYHEGNYLRVCNESKLAVWPDNNQYFKFAINEMIFKQQRCYLADGVVFVDFSLSNILMFIKDEWLEFLSRTGMALVLVTDKEMLPIANYWYSQSNAVRAILQPQEEDADALRKKVRKVFYGASLTYQKLPRVTRREMSVLDLVLQGKSVAEIAGQLNCQPKSIYEYKASLRRKFGGWQTLRKLKLCL